MSEFPTLLKGRRLAEEIINALRTKIMRLGEAPHIAIILVGDDDASKIFIKLKQRACEKIGARSTLFKLEENLDEYKLLELIGKLNEDPRFHGILLQLPLPEQIDENKMLNKISPEKDVDGLTPKNIGNLLLGTPRITPCAVSAILRLLEDNEIRIEGKNVVIINRSNLIGKPLATLLIKRSATVTICHSKTEELESHTRSADILITATGRPRFITADMVKRESVIIDAGCTKFGGRFCGDVDFETVSKKVSAITPVPGGVGPLTIAMTMENLLRCYESQIYQKKNTKG